MITNTSDIIIGYIVRQDYNNGTKKRMFEVMLNQYISILNSIYILRTCTCHIGANANYGHYVTYYFNGTHSTCINDSIIEDGSFILNDGIWRNLNNRQTVSIVIYERIGDNSDPMSLTNNIVNNETQAVEEHHTEQQKCGQFSHFLHTFLLDFTFLNLLIIKGLRWGFKKKSLKYVKIQ